MYKIIIMFDLLFLPYDDISFTISMCDILHAYYRVSESAGHFPSPLHSTPLHLDLRQHF
jgi:hypothetical protein